MGEQKKWSMARNSLSISGSNIGAGAGTDAFLKVTPRGDWRTVTVGIQGDAIINEMLDRSCDFELTLLQTSTANKKLNALLNRTQFKNGDVGVGPFHYEELDGLTEIVGDCVLTAPPEYNVGAEGQNVVWKGVIIATSFFVGGRGATGGVTISFTL